MLVASTLVVAAHRRWHVLAGGDRGGDGLLGRWFLRTDGLVDPAHHDNASVLAGDWLPAGDGEPDQRVPPEMLVVLGDNAESSWDSRQAGFIPAASVLGVVVRPLLAKTPATAPRCRLPTAQCQDQGRRGSRMSALVHRLCSAPA